MQRCLTPSVGSSRTTSSPVPSRSSFACRGQYRESTIWVRTQPPKVSLAANLCSQLSLVPVNQSTLAAIVLPVAAACTVLMGCPVSAEAGILSGTTGLEYFEIPSLPTPDVLKKIQEANVAKYKAFDENFRKSSFLQELLKKSKENKEMHRKEIEDKYCERGAEWGVGDCSLRGLPQADRDAFFEVLRNGKVVESRK